MSTNVYGSVANPKWSSNANVNIDCEVFFYNFNTVLPFTASATDSTDYGREIHARCLAGEFGTIAPYEPKANIS
jgi:hypothetical protein